MGLLSSIFEKRDLGYNDPKAWNSSLWNLYGIQSKSGVHVNEETALTFSAVFNAIVLISGTIAALPLFVYQRVDRGKKQATKHPLYDLLHVSPNPEMSAMTFRETTIAHVLAWGNMFAEKVFDYSGKIIQLWPIPPDKVEIIRKKDGDKRLEYHVRLTDGSKRIISRERMLHIPGLGFNGIQGYSVINKARESLGLAMAAEEFGSRFFGTGTHPGVIAKHPGVLSPEGHENLKNSLIEKYSGLGKSHRLLLLEEGMSLENIGIPPEDAQFLQTRQFQVTEVARWFNIPPHKIKDLERSTFSNIEHQAIEFVQDSILPWLTRFEQGYTIQLLSAKNRKKYFFEHVVEGLLRGDSAARSTYYKDMFMIGVMSINDIREKDNMNPVDGGDERFVPLNMVPLSQIGEYSNITEPIEPEPEIDYEENERFWRRGKLKRSAAGRVRLGVVYKNLFLNAARNIVNQETKAINVAVDKELNGNRNESSFISWMDSYYAELPDIIKKKMLPVIRSYAEPLLVETGKEIGKTIEMTPEIERFIREYIDTYSKRHIGSSKGQVNKLLKESKPDEIADVIVKRMDEWTLKRPGKIAERETVRSGNALARKAMIVAGIVRFIWVSQGSENCPFCQELDGKIIGIEESFVSGGDEVSPDGTEPMAIKGGPKFHPPLHDGCICQIMAA